MSFGRRIYATSHKWIQAYRADALTKQKGKCYYCGKRIWGKSVTADHLIPKSKGGTDSKENIVASCRRCNRLKGSLGEEFFKTVIHDPKLIKKIKARIKKLSS